MKARAVPVVVAVAAAFLPGLVAPASAARAAAVLTVQGSCTVSPGLGLFAEEQSWSCTGTATATGTPSGVFSCNAAVHETAGSMAGGFGTAQGSCGPFTFPSCVWVRQVNHAVVACSWTVGAANGDFVLRPVDTLPTTVVTFVGTVHYVSV